MGIFIFLIGIIFEIPFAVFCIKTKSNQKKVSSIIRIIAFIVFVVLTLLSVIHWGLRYYALAAVLLLQTLISMVGLIRKRPEKREYKLSRVLWKTIGMTAIIFVATLPAIIFPDYKPLETTGQYTVATVTYTYTDTKRIETFTNTDESRKLNVQLWYPKNAEGKYPLVIFSHGGISNKSSNESLYNELASHGYVVCSIDHTYHSLSTTDDEGKKISIDSGYMKELNTEDAKSDPQQSYKYYQKWMKIRTDDINFVIDYIIAEAKDNDMDLVYKLVDTGKIGVMGHSLGGSAALGIGRLRKDINAVIALESPFMYDIEGVEDGKFVFKDEVYPTPVLNVYSDSSWNHLDEWPQYAANYALLSDKKATAFNVYISGVGHFTLTDLALSSPILTRIFNGQKSTADTEYCLKIINKISLEFFDCYLKRKGEFKSQDKY
jgi:dienelactone hydrolase